MDLGSYKKVITVLVLFFTASIVSARYNTKTVTGTFEKSFDVYLGLKDTDVLYIEMRHSKSTEWLIVPMGVVQDPPYPYCIVYWKGLHTKVTFHNVHRVDHYRITIIRKGSFSKKSQKTFYPDWSDDDDSTSVKEEQ